MTVFVGLVASYASGQSPLINDIIFHDQLFILVHVHCMVEVQSRYWYVSGGEDQEELDRETLVSLNAIFSSCRTSASEDLEVRLYLYIYQVQHSNMFLFMSMV